MDYIKCPKCGEIIDLEQKKQGVKCDFCGKENLKTFYFAYDEGLKENGETKIKCEECKKRAD